MSKEESKGLGGRIAGGVSARGRVKNDYYATPPEDVQHFLDTIIEDGFDIQQVDSILEPAAGGGHLLDVVKDVFPHAICEGIDIDPKRDDIQVFDFLTDKVIENYDLVITNPPFKHAKEFINHSLEISNRYVMYYLKLQFLEGKSRKDWFMNDVPLKYVYVYSYRSSPYRNGNPYNEKGKRWSSTIAYAWFVMDKEYEGEPIIRWL